MEKETGLVEERPAIAGVFIRRLQRGMRLQTDPSVIYGITKGVGVLGRGLRQSELRGKTPWNTYVIEGLPPTPIANPGLASLQAAAQAALLVLGSSWLLQKTKNSRSMGCSSKRSRGQAVTQAEQAVQRSS